MRGQRKRDLGSRRGLYIAGRTEIRAQRTYTSAMNLLKRPEKPNISKPSGFFEEPRKDRNMIHPSSLLKVEYLEIFEI
jgi:hypothetical protein